MALSRRIAPWLRAALGVIMGAALLASSTATAHANGVHIGSREVYAGEVGAYQLSVSATPVAGPMHVVVRVAAADGDAPVPSATLTLQAALVDGAGSAVGPVSGYRTIEGPHWHAADLEVFPAGQWRFTLAVDSELGPEQVQFVVPVLEPGGNSLTILVLVIAALAILGFTLGNRTFSRRRRRGSRRD